jgi:hypothetical protein
MLSLFVLGRVLVHSTPWFGFSLLEHRVSDRREMNYLMLNSDYK